MPGNPKGKRVHKKKAANVANPFDRRKIRVKQEVLGRKSQVAEHSIGLSRSHATQLRKETLLPDIRRLQRTSKFVDKRLGEDNPGLSTEEKMFARWHFERKKRRKDIYNLDDEEELTHMGTGLGEPGALDEEPEGFSGDDKDIAGEIDANVVAAAHFGGGGDQGSGTDPDRNRSAAIYSEIIARSKLQRFERQRQKEENNLLLGELDKQFTDAQLEIMSKRRKRGEGKDDVKNQAEKDFDRTVREFVFEARAKATDRLKRPEEVAKEQKEELERLERERLARMKNDDEDDVETDEEQAEMGVQDKSTIGGIRGRKQDSRLPYLSQLSNKLPNEQLLLLNRVLVCNHPKLDPKNEDLLVSLYFLLLQHFSAAEEIDAIDAVVPFVVALTHELQEKAADSARKFIRELYSSTAKMWRFPKFGQAAVLKLIGSIFPSSDFRHTVTTPAIILMTHCLSLCPLLVTSDIFLGLLLCSVIQHYVQLSHRVVPEAISFLTSVVILGCISPDDVSASGSLCSYFSLPTLVSTQKPASEGQMALHQSLWTEGPPFAGDPNKAVPDASSILHCALLQLHHFVDLYQDGQVKTALFAPARTILARCCQTFEEPWNENLLHLACGFISKTEFVFAQEHHGTGLSTVVRKFPAFRTVKRLNPTPIPEYIPAISEAYIHGRDPDVDTNRARVRKLQRLVKREQKSAVRELRKDAEFVGQEHVRSKEKEQSFIREREGKILEMLQRQEHDVKSEKKGKR